MKQIVIVEIKLYLISSAAKGWNLGNSPDDVSCHQLKRVQFQTLRIVSGGLCSRPHKLRKISSPVLDIFIAQDLIRHPKFSWPHHDPPKRYM